MESGRRHPRPFGFRPARAFTAPWTPRRHCLNLIVHAEMSRAGWYDDDPDYDYRRFWTGREYEHAAEEVALRRLLGRDHVARAVDVGGGYGRLSKLLARYADSVVLVDPSRHQLRLAADYLRAESRVECRHADAANLLLPDASVDLLLLVRVLHHVPDPRAAFTEFARVLTPGGKLVLEFANGANVINRLRLRLRGRSVPAEPISVAVASSGTDTKIPYVTHSPHRVLDQLRAAGFEVDAVLSVSNLRSARLKRLLPLPVMVAVERLLQPVLGPFWFGPSIWLRLHLPAGPLRPAGDLRSPGTTADSSASDP